jgi:hypothetical protein
MDFIKKNYEKVLLGLVLAGLVLAVASLPFLVSSEKQRLEDARNQLINRPVRPMEPTDLGRAELLVRRLGTPVTLDFSTTNKLFNPVPWQRAVDGRMIKAEEGNIGPRAVAITRITPLYLTITLDNISIADSGARYVIGVEREAASRADQRRKRQYYTSVGEKKEGFILRSVKGPADNPTELVLELTDTGETISISRGNPFRRVDGHMADLRYDPERRNFPARRVGMPMVFGGEEYNVVAITETEVVLSAKSNNKKTTIRYTAPT